MDGVPASVNLHDLYPLASSKTIRACANRTVYIQKAGRYRKEIWNSSEGLLSLLKFYGKTANRVNKPEFSLCVCMCVVLCVYMQCACVCILFPVVMEAHGSKKSTTDADPSSVTNHLALRKQVSLHHFS